MKLLVYAISLSLALYSCNIINPDEQDPAFLQIEDYSFHAGTGKGTSSSKLTETWVNADDNLLSISSFGAQIPVLKNGRTKISVFPGIKNFGASDMRIFYPFYQPFDTIIDFTPLSYHKITPRFTYYSTALVDASRDFESGSNFSSYGLNQGYFNEINNPQIVFEGNKCARVYLSGENTFFQFKDENEIVIENGNTVFLEMNYSCNHPFTIGVFSVQNGSTYSNDLVTMSATAASADIAWNKIYIDLSVIGLLYANAESHNLYVKCIKSGSDVPEVYLDNLKIVKWQ